MFPEQMIDWPRPPPATGNSSATPPCDLSQTLQKNSNLTTFREVEVQRATLPEPGSARLPKSLPGDTACAGHPALMGHAAPTGLFSKPSGSL